MELTFLINLLPVFVSQSLDLLLKLLVLSCGLFLRVVVVGAHGQGQPVSVLLQRGSTLLIKEDSDFPTNTELCCSAPQLKDLNSLLQKQGTQKSIIYFEVEFDFVLKEARVFFQRLSEPSDAFTYSQQLHRVAVVVPGGRDVLKRGKNKSTDCSRSQRGKNG